MREDEAYQRLTELLDEQDELMEKIDRLDQGIGRQPQQGDSTAVQQELRAEMLRLQEQNEVVEKVLQSSLAQLRGQAKRFRMAATPTGPTLRRPQRRRFVYR